MFVPFYWIIPLVSALVWLGMLLGLLLNWVTIGEPIYPSMNAGQTIAYISDTGAYKYKPLFIAGSTIMVVLLDASLIAERWLRHNGRLAPNTTWLQKGCSICAILASIAGALGIILLSIYDTYHYPTMHDRCLIVFLVGYVVSAIFICAEYQQLGAKFTRHPVLKASFYVKLAFIIIEIALAIPFGIFEEKNENVNTGAILEWIIAFIFTGYILSFVMDLLPAIRTHHHMSHAAVAEMGEYGGPNGYTNGFPYDSEITNANNQSRAPVTSNF